MDIALGPEFTRTLGLPNVNKPQAVDLNAVNPAYRSIYEAYNNALANYDLAEQSAREYAATAQSNLNRELGTTLQQLENQRRSNIDLARQGGQDAQTQNRIRARAIGGAPSSGFLELANRIDRDTNRGILGFNQQASIGATNARTAALRALADIENNLNNQIFQISQNRNLSLRERDAAIQDAISRAQARAAQTVDWDSFLNSFGEEDVDQGSGRVLGANTMQFVPGAIGSKTGGGLLFRQPVPAPQSIPTAPNSANDSLNLINNQSTQRFPTNLVYGGQSRPIR